MSKAVGVFHYDGVPDDKLFQVSLEEASKSTKMSWSQVPADSFKIRDPNYLTDGKKKKQPSDSAAFEIVTIKVFATDFFPYHLAENLASLKSYLSKYPDEFFVIVARICPTKPKYTCVHVARRILPVGQDVAFDKLFERFVKGDEAYRNKRFKYMAKLLNAPYIVSGSLKALGGERPAILGNALRQHHYSGANYVEVDVDIGSSGIAKRIAGMALGVLEKMLVKEAFLIEAQENDELPERLLFSNAFHGCNIKTAAVSLSAEDKKHFTKNPFGAAEQ